MKKQIVQSNLEMEIVQIIMSKVNFHTIKLSPSRVHGNKLMERTPKRRHKEKNLMGLAVYICTTTKTSGI